MSLRSMAVMRAEAERGARVVDAETPGGPKAGEPQRAPMPGRGPGGQGSQLDRSRDQLIALIPAEAVALFILLIGLTEEEAVGWRLGVLLGVSLFAVGWTLLSYWEAKGGRQGAALPTFEIAVGLIAFLAWSTSVPASPFADLDLPTFVGPAIVAVVSALLVLGARARAVWTKQIGQA
jgi:hypothetical protein